MKAQYRYKAKISDDLEDAREIIKNVGRTLKEGKTDLPSALTNLAEALNKLDSAKYYLERE
jgi:septation ring formation regulator EzrA